MDENQFRILMRTLDGAVKTMKELSDTMSDVASAWLVLEGRLKMIQTLVQRDKENAQ